MDFDGSVNTAATETETEEEKKLKNSVVMSLTLAFLASRGSGGDAESKTDELYGLFTEFLDATGYVVVKKEI